MKGTFSPLVLCYHGVSESVDHELLVRPGQLVRQVRVLERRGFRPASAGEVLGGRGRLLHLTFDDAFRSVRLVLPQLRELGVPVTIFACSDLAVSGTLAVPEVTAAAAAHPEEFAVMDWDELREVAAEGVTVGSHTCSHPRLTRLTDAELDRELVDSKQSIEQELGRACSLLAYPYGDEDGRVQSAARRAGYAAAFALPGRRRNPDSMALPRVDLYRKHGLVTSTLKTTFLARR